MKTLERLEKQRSTADQLCGLEIEKAKAYQQKGDITKAGFHYAEAMQWAELSHNLFCQILDKTEV